MKGTWNSRVNPMILTHDLQSLGSWAMCSAHRLTERNIWVKFNEIRPKVSGDLKRTRNSRVNPLTCDLESR